MQGTAPSGTVRQAALAPAQVQARARQQPCAAATLARSPAIRRQQAGRTVMVQRRLSARAAKRQGAVSVVAKAGGEVLVVGSSGQTAARVVVNLLKAGFKVTAGALHCIALHWALQSSKLPAGSLPR